MTQRSKPLSKMPKPDYLMSEKAHEIWVEIGNKLIQHGLLTDSELDDFKIYCCVEARRINLINALRRSQQ